MMSQESQPSVVHLGARHGQERRGAEPVRPVGPVGEQRPGRVDAGFLKDIHAGHLRCAARQSMGWRSRAVVTLHRSADYTGFRSGRITLGVMALLVAGIHVLPAMALQGKGHGGDEPSHARPRLQVFRPEGVPVYLYCVGSTRWVQMACGRVTFVRRMSASSPSSIPAADAIQGRGRNRAVGGEIAVQRIDIGGAGDALIGALAEHRKAVAAIDQKSIDGHPV